MTIKDYTHQHSQGLVEAAKISPPRGVLGSEALGANLQNGILIGTAIYTFLLVVHKIFQIWKDVHKFRNNSPDTTVRGDL